MTRASLGICALFALLSLVAAAFHRNAALVGWSAAIAFFAVAVAAGSAAVALRAPNDLREPRKAHGPTHPEPLPRDVVVTRGVFSRWWGLAAGAFGVLALAPLVALSRRGSPEGTAWSKGARLVTADGTPLRADALDVGGVTTVFPEHHVGAPQAATLLIRIEDGALRTPADRDGWAPQGNVAYSKICTHAGCPVAIYRHASHQLYCPCHQSVFDVLHAAMPVSGPATRALPQLALDVDEAGFLIARGDFSEPVGPDQWSRPL